MLPLVYFIDMIEPRFLLRCKKVEIKICRQDEKDYKKLLVLLMNEINSMESVLKVDGGD